MPSLLPALLLPVWTLPVWVQEEPEGSWARSLSGGWRDERDQQSCFGLQRAPSGWSPPGDQSERRDLWNKPGIWDSHWRLFTRLPAWQVRSPRQPTSCQTFRNDFSKPAWPSLGRNPPVQPSPLPLHISHVDVTHAGSPSPAKSSLRTAQGTPDRLLQGQGQAQGPLGTPRASSSHPLLLPK